MRKRVQPKTQKINFFADPFGISDKAMKHALNNPEIVKYAKNLRRIQVAYKALEEEQSKNICETRSNM